MKIDVFATIREKDADFTQILQLFSGNGVSVSPNKRGLNERINTPLPSIFDPLMLRLCENFPPIRAVPWYLQSCSETESPFKREPLAATIAVAPEPGGTPWRVAASAPLLSRLGTGRAADGPRLRRDA